MASTAQTLAGWRWRRHGTGDAWQHCAHANPTTEIFVDLLDAQQIPDPFLDQNERLVQWVGEADWEYIVDVVHEHNDRHARQDLVFEGLDTYASVYLNERHILTSSNMFHRHRINVTDVLKPGVNELRIVFQSALRQGRALEAAHGSFRAFNGEGSRLHVRKAQYHYGWDWGPILLSCGPYREIRLESYAATVHDVFARGVVADNLQHATLNISWSMLYGLDREADVEVDVTVKSPSQLTFQSHARLGVGDSKGDVTLEIPQPELWCPVGHGPQPLYTIHVSVRSEQHEMNDVLHQTSTTIGLRRLRLVQQPLLDEPGTSFFLEVNNQPVYISGTNFIPDHSFLTKLTPKDYAATVQSCLDGNQNMLRVWGGGIYEHESLYAECDRRGVLVWQDFMFACGQYPCYPDFAKSVKREAADQLKRLRNYCSIVLYAGNNEDYQVIESLNLDYDPSDHSGDWTATNFPARTIYETYLPAAVTAYAPDVPYHPSSPWGGKASSDLTVGDIHQWDVWHGTQEPYQLWDKLTGRFVSEFGMLAYPSLRSVPRFVTDPAQRHPQSAVMELHNKAEGSVHRMARYVLENLRIDSMGLESYIYATQLVQAECLASAIRGCRRRWRGPAREYCGGQLIWQLNDCWPVSSWGIIDFYGERKLAFYATKRDSAALAIGIHRSTPEMKRRVSPPPLIPGAPHDLSVKRYIFDVWAVNSTLQDTQVTVQVRLYDTVTGQVRCAKALDSEPQMHVIAANRAQDLLEDQYVDGQTVVQAIMRDGQGRILSRGSDWPQPLKHVELPPSYDIRLQVTDGQVSVTTDRPLKALELYVADQDQGRTICWDDNGIDVLPGDTYVVKADGLRENDDVLARFYGMEWVPHQVHVNESPLNMNGIDKAPHVDMNGASNGLPNGTIKGPTKVAM